MKNALAALAAAAVLAGAPLARGEQAPGEGIAGEPEAHWWTQRYLWHYGVIAASAGGFLVAHRLDPREEALIGPVYDPDDPLDVIASSSLDSRLGNEASPWLRRSLIGAGGVVVALDAFAWSQGGSSTQRLHDGTLGFVQALSLSSTAKVLLKVSVGRLRPDFGERALTYHCTVEPEEYEELCDRFADRMPDVDRDGAEELIREGKKSFYSGRTSAAFGAATYASLLLGSRFVWGPEATARSRAAGVAAQSTLMATAAYIAASRTSEEGLHHTSDIVAGGLIGVGLANLAYWLHFRADGSLRNDSRRAGPRRLSLDAGPTPDASGLSLSLTFTHE